MEAVALDHRHDGVEHDDVRGAVRAALRIMGMPTEDFELTLFPTPEMQLQTTRESILSVRRLPLGEPRLYLVTDGVPWLMQMVGDLCEGRL